MGRHKIIGDVQLLQHARDVFLKGGAFGSTKEIARRAGISEATLFQRYPTKAALFLAAMVPPEVDVKVIVHAPTKRMNPQGALTEIGQRMLAYFRSLIPTVMHLMMHPSISMADVTAHFQRMPEHALAEALATYLRDAEARGKVKVHDPMAAASLLVSAIHSLAVFELMEMHGGQDLEHAVELFVKALWSGLDPKRQTRKTNTPHRKGTRES
jgi:AcrR family transcriptional regulator